MKVFRGLPNAASRAPCALAIGNFDGVHLGHQTLLAHLRAAASALGIDAAVMTFEPHPRAYFAQTAGDLSLAPARIANLRDNMGSLAHAGVDRVIVKHFNAHFAALSPQDFIEKILVQGLHVKWLMVGEDFCFGAKRAGTIATLEQAGRQFGFTVVTLPSVQNKGVRISSSAVRTALAAADFAETEALLGHPYRISGHVVHGQKLGRTIGFPTLNLRIAHHRPALSGIFIVRIHGLADTPLAGVASLGVRPTVDDSGRVLLETHVFDYQGHAYGKVVQIEFLEKLRDEAKYSDLATLTAAIDHDAAQARAYFDASQRIPAITATDRI
ncbi:MULTISPECIES: bifunctional riboflavin kinase/FAD synthetase [unclassified Undibacterium]|uniref:bifunctional riboflavin kinase/FAD synthetase n=1 Tax=unclassified Undibacterium TaxID=2630295 RepID=UPI002AC8A28C|nr:MULTISPECIES: bifunctional riboflavin kinase/FAD synthetase [unclassified Undibacterium]MEB0139105.1 bifunctional riboflavin kinase/FAD synthetase [Undibacterium sp. CCC2.1]MEB0173446.1 bifunctional riboflavin kinase/FAD synthetase [Undibacterium sp. CCC1.1]MEB0177180.1 bifunctional riboflavin kinase/FAD synthetase [Undibacterium sp. CCC3.4]MEB0216445.1 bifunctional riboflavin kinase/FAD synthetase [Undibacterium sp. 5I2]WPX42059.1 bifunctional riboflavin kinase/FAD synthetase [Undibacteriu